MGHFSVPGVPESLGKSRVACLPRLSEPAGCCSPDAGSHSPGSGLRAQPSGKLVSCAPAFLTPVLVFRPLGAAVLCLGKGFRWRRPSIILLPLYWGRQNFLYFTQIPLLAKVICVNHQGLFIDPPTLALILMNSVFPHPNSLVLFCYFGVFLVIFPQSTFVSLLLLGHLTL